MTKKPSKDYGVGPFEILDPLKLSFGTAVPRAAKIAWGYRAIKEYPGFSLLHDRQTLHCDLPGGDPQRKAFKKAIDTVMIPALQDHAETLSSSDSKMYYYRFPGILDGADILATQSPLNSYGYVYGAAWTA